MKPDSILDQKGGVFQLYFSVLFNVQAAVINFNTSVKLG